MLGKEWALGSNHRDPESNCCVCGKGKEATAMVNLNTISNDPSGGHSAGSRVKLLMGTGSSSKAAARKQVMKEFPSKLKGAASLEDLQASCVDPALDDPESWECECAEDMTATCGGVDEECFRGLLCKNANICAEWKQTHCPESLIESLAKRSTHSTSFGQSYGDRQPRHQVAGGSGALPVDARELLENRVVSINAAKETTHLSNTDGLDDTLTGKCSQ